MDYSFEGRTNSSSESEVMCNVLERSLLLISLKNCTTHSINLGRRMNGCALFNQLCLVCAFCQTQLEAGGGGALDIQSLRYRTF